ncbi:hypothetical protein ACIQM4_17460 [Streptomyces sp. NPDC091272]|uniref:hypothetical protein n=1 Tax=Streptomyces sp. NPDC091272 TaxID=3365981 RepID=UPI00381E5003
MTNKTGFMRKAIAVPLSLAVACVAGVAVWKFTQDPLVHVPDRVCRASLPGDSVEPLFPRRGEEFREEYGYGFSTAGATRAPGLCELTAAGESLRLRYSLLLRPEVRGWDDVLRDVRKPGNVPVSLGPARGFAEGHSVTLYVRCTAPRAKEILLAVQVGVSGNPLTEDRPRLTKAGALTADIARNVTPRVVHCGSAPRLPPGPPSTG